jgi:hypothetical protein
VALVYTLGQRLERLPGALHARREKVWAGQVHVHGHLLEASMVLFPAAAAHHASSLSSLDAARGIIHAKIQGLVRVMSILSPQPLVVSPVKIQQGHNDGGQRKAAQVVSSQERRNETRSIGIHLRYSQGDWNRHVSFRRRLLTQVWVRSTPINAGSCSRTPAPDTAWDPGLQCESWGIHCITIDQHRNPGTQGIVRPAEHGTVHLVVPALYPPSQPYPYPSQAAGYCGLIMRLI